MQRFQPFTFLLVSQKLVPKAVCPAALTLTSGAPPGHQQRLLTETKNFHTSTTGQTQTLKFILGSHLGRTGQETSRVSRCHQTSSRCICLYHSQSGFGFPTRLSVHCCQFSSWNSGQSSCLCMDRKSHPFACVFTKNMHLTNTKLPLFNIFLF